MCGALVISGGTGLYFSYQENKEAIARLEREKALNAAARIGQFVRQVEQQLAYATPQLGVETLAQRRLELMKLQRFAKEVTDVSQIDASGREQLFESRLAMSVVASGKDRSAEPAFANARPGRTWFGPVYFRRDSEPYMSIAVRSGGEKGPVTVAEVNLKFIWDVVSRIRVGQKGKAYVVDGAGYLIADPDIGLVLRKTDLSGLAQVKAALQADADAERAMLAKDFNGAAVLTAWAPIDLGVDGEGRRREPLGWRVFVEQPVSEVFAALDATILRTVLLIVAGLLLSALVAMWLARSMARPIGVLQEGAQRIGAGELDHQIDVHTGDELEALAGQFNRMSAQLRESYAGLERKVEERTQELKASLEQQTAISEILRVISRSPSDVKPVLEAVAERAARICEANDARIFVVEGHGLRFVTAFGDLPGAISAGETRPIERSYVAGRSAHDRAVIHVADMQAVADEYPTGLAYSQAHGIRTFLAVPLLREERALGVILLRRSVVRPFTDKQISLLKTFADQAAIAIENVRLFNETRESLEKQTATAEILRVLSSNPADTQPVFQAIARNAARLCGSAYANVFRYDGERLYLAASHGVSAEVLASLQRTYPMVPNRSRIVGRVILEGRVVRLEDTQVDPEYDQAYTRSSGQRRLLGVPLERAGEPVGAIAIAWQEPGPILDRHEDLLRTFADQAVIAIENVRLFNETKEALEQQTAIGDVLRVISSTPSDVKPTLDAVAERAVRLCDASAVSIYVLEGATLRRTAFNGPAELSGNEALPLDPGTLTGRTIAEGRPVHIEDVERAQQEFPLTWELAQKYGRRQSMLALPLMREGKAFGTMFLRRTEVRPFGDKQIALATTFANQAAIAIQNVRLFNETVEALEQQKASGEILATLSSSIADTQPVFDKILRSCERLFAGRQVGINLVDAEGRIRIGAYQGPGREELERVAPFPPGDASGSGAAIAHGRVMHYPDARAEEVPPTTRRGCAAIGVKAAIFAPMLWEGRGIGVIFVGRDYAGPFSEKEIALLRTFADQAVIAIQNARLFREIQEKSAQLEVANKHKSEFLANMSHELRTPLNAIIGFSEVLMEKMFGEVNEKQADYLKDIHESGRHLLSLINDILDLSKIEAGRMELELSTFHLPSAIGNAMTLVRERAQRHNITLGLEVDGRVGEFHGDERKVKQILLNLLSNAVKFTPDGGRVDVSARLDTTHVAIAVRDTGIGIASEDQPAVFEEFRQVGRDYTRKAEGTGLGLALARRFVELHGGEIRLESAPGQGSTFTFTLPVRP